MARIIRADDTNIYVHYWLAQTTRLDTATWLPAYQDKDNSLTRLKKPRRGFTPYTGIISRTDINRLVVLRRVDITSGGKLSYQDRKSIKAAGYRHAHRCVS